MTLSGKDFKWVSASPKRMVLALMVFSASADLPADERACGLLEIVAIPFGKMRFSRLGWVLSLCLSLHRDQSTIGRLDMLRELDAILHKRSLSVLVEDCQIAEFFESTCASFLDQS